MKSQTNEMRQLGSIIGDVIGFIQEIMATNDFLRIFAQ